MKNSISDNKKTFHEDETILSQSKNVTSNENYILNNKRAIFNVGGKKHEVLWTTISKLPDTRLARIRYAANKEELMVLCDDFDLEKNEFYFDRDPLLFDTVINYYRSGTLHINHDVCPVYLDSELNYWDIVEPSIDICCDLKLSSKREHIQKEVEKDEKIIQSIMKKTSHYKCLPKIGKKVWSIIDDPTSSLTAKIFGSISIFFILLSTFTLVVSTFPEIQRFNKEDNKNSTLSFFSQNIEINKIMSTLDIIEIICISWFTFEILARFAFTPSYKRFFLSVSNLIDFLCIVPFYLGLFLDKYEFFYKIKYLLQMLRILRIIKLARHSPSLKSFGYTFRKSSKELLMLLMYMTINVLLFSSFVFYAEQDEPDTRFTSIVTTFWWSIVTITTVGYGDMTPTSAVGKMVGSVCAVFGIISISLPLAIIASKFSDYYKHDERKKKILKQMQSKNSLNKNYIDSDTRSGEGSDKALLFRV